MRVCPETKKIIPDAKDAREEDFYEEYLGPIISIKIVTQLMKQLNILTSTLHSIQNQSLQKTRKILKDSSGKLILQVS
jgi:gamma-glutamyl phosphate reductase